MAGYDPIAAAREKMGVKTQSGNTQSSASAVNDPVAAMREKMAGGSSSDGLQSSQFQFQNLKRDYEKVYNALTADNGYFSAQEYQDYSKLLNDYLGDLGAARKAAPRNTDYAQSLAVAQKSVNGLLSYLDQQNSVIEGYTAKKIKDPFDDLIRADDPFAEKARRNRYESARKKEEKALADYTEYMAGLDAEKQAWGASRVGSEAWYDQRQARYDDLVQQYNDTMAQLNDAESAGAAAGEFA